MDATQYPYESKSQLLAIAKGLRACDPAAIESAVAFFIRETRGHWHNRARAKFARRLKHCSLPPLHANAIVNSVVRRLASGQFSEQFGDQLRLALHLDSPAVLQAARQALSSPLEHVRRYAGWVVAHHGAADAP